MKKIKHLLANGNVELVCLIGGIGVLAWVFGAYQGGGVYIEEYAAMFPVGGPVWWAANYAVAGILLIIYALCGLPRNFTAVFGLWMMAFWGWQLYVRLNTIEQQATNATSVFLIIVGALLFWRGGKKL